MSHVEEVFLNFKRSIKMTTASVDTIERLTYTSGSSSIVLSGSMIPSMEASESNDHDPSDSVFFAAFHKCTKVGKYAHTKMI